MKFRSTLILVALAIGLGLFVYFYEIRGGHERQEAEDKAKKVVIVKDADIDSIEIIRPGLEPLRVEKNESANWILTSPLKVRADSGSVGSITWQLSDLSFAQVASENPADLEPFGLITPEIEVTFEADEIKKTLLFGADTPIGSDTYLRVKGESRVLVVSRHTKDSFDKHAVDLRDKHVVAFDQADIVGLEISTVEQKLSFERRDKDWWLKSPKEVDANDDKVQGVLDQLSTLEAEEFVPHVVALSMNLGESDVEITLVIGAAERASKRVIFWKIGDGKKALAYPEKENWLYKIPATIVDDAAKTFAYFREHRVVTFDRFDLAEIVIRTDSKAEPVVLKKDDSGDWHITGPKSAKGKAAPGKVFDLIDSLEELMAADFVDDPPPASESGLDKGPTVVLYAKGKAEGEKKELGRLVLGKKVKGARRYARGAGPQVFLLDAAFFLPKGPKAFQEKKAAPEPEALTPEVK